MDQTELLEQAKSVIPGACLGAMSLPEDIQMVMVRGERSKVYDANGKEYIDYVLGSGPLIVGHSHPAVIGAVEKQLTKGSTFYALNEPAIRLASLLTEAVPCAEAVRFQTTGTEAVFSALRLARGYTGREKVLTFDGAFHGGLDVGQIRDSDGIPRATAKDVLVAPFNNTDRTTDLIDANRKRLAAVLIEPLQRVLRPEPGFLETIREVTRDRAIPLIFDEVVTGFRLAWGGAQERYGVIPDLACYGKILGGGFPLSAVVGRRDILELADPRRKGKERYCFLGGTLTGNPIACAAGLETLDILRTPGVYELLHATGERLRNGIQSIGIDLNLQIHVLGEGPVLQPYFLRTKTSPRNHHDLQKASRRRAVTFSHELIRRGIYCTPGGKMYLSIAHTNDDIERTIEITREVLKVL